MTLAGAGMEGSDNDDGNGGCHMYVPPTRSSIRICLNAGLALHVLSTNASRCLSASLNYHQPEPPHRTAPHRRLDNNLQCHPTKCQMMSEGSAAAAIATDNGDDAVAVLGTKS